MVSCAVVGCSNRTGQNSVGFFRVPKVITNQCSRTRGLSEKRQHSWLARLNRRVTDLTTSSGLHVCSAHFIQGYPSKLFEEYSPDWVPSVDLGESHENLSSEGKSLIQDNNKEPDIKNLSSTMFETEEGGEEEDESSSDSEDELISDPPVQAEDLDVMSTKQSECQTELTTRDIYDLEQEVSTMQCEMETLRAKILDTELSEHAFQNGEGKVRFYTGFSSYAMLMVAFNFVKVSLKYTYCNLTHFQEFIMFMLRIRLNLPLHGLAFRFNVSEETASRICDKWLDAMYVCLGCIVSWPDRKVLKQTMPQVFHDVLGDKAAVIVDCLELTIDRPSTSLGQCTTWIDYKNHNTVKFLIGTTPQGAISFISEACGGRACNKYIADHSGLLEHLLPGDVVLADKGFGIAESVGYCCACVVRPKVPGQKKQLSAFQVHEMYKFLPLKSYMEQEFGLVRSKYHILQTCLPVEYLTCREGEDASVIDKIVTVCCALTNLSKSVLSLVQT